MEKDRNGIEILRPCVETICEYKNNVPGENNLKYLNTSFSFVLISEKTGNNLFDLIKLNLTILINNYYYVNNYNHIVDYISKQNIFNINMTYWYVQTKSILYIGI